jgi:serine/threonine protein kinase
MGTVGYMSPEQAQGKTNEIDQRSDIFSFGCILFEAATGHKAFAGKDVLDSLHKIVHAPTPQISEINANAPAELQRIEDSSSLFWSPDSRTIGFFANNKLKKGRYWRWACASYLQCS